MAIVPPDDGSPFDALRRVSPEGMHYWSARELQPVMGYERWERFDDVIQRATIACRNSGYETAEHFRGAAKNPSSQGGRPARDWLISRYAAYLVAMNGDPRKPEIAAAQTYFAVKTREAESRNQTALPQDYEEALVHLLGRVRENKQLESRVRELEPSAQAWDSLASAEGDYALRDAAHILNRDRGISTGQNRLLRTIREFEMVDRGGVPYAKHSAHLAERPTSYTHPHTGEAILSKQLRVTVQGLRYLHRRMGGQGPLQLPLGPAA